VKPRNQSAHSGFDVRLSGNAPETDGSMKVVLTGINPLLSSESTMFLAQKKLDELINDYVKKSRPTNGSCPIRFEFLFDKKIIAEYSLSTSELSIKTQDQKQAQR
jgi:hypothetical protein